MPRIDNRRLKELESRLGVVVPSSFVATLVGREPIIEGDVAILTDYRDWDVRTTFRLDDGPSDEQLDDLYDRVGHVLPPGTLPFAADWGGNFYCLMLTGALTGQVVYWSHERGPNDDSVEFVSESIESFFDQMTPGSIT